MSDIQWNSVTVEEDEAPRVSLEDLREMAADLDPEDFDEPVQVFLSDLQMAQSVDELSQVATLLLQDEVDFSPELAELGVEPDTDLIALLLSCGADVNALNPYGESPLHLASRYGYAPLVEMLVAAGAKRHLPNREGKTAADVAANPAIAAYLTPLSADDAQLPPEVLDGDYEPEEEEGHECHCGCHHDHGGDHECHCGHHHH